MRTGLGAGVVLTSPKGDKLKYVLQVHFAASNNVVEYEALIHGLRLAKELDIRRILCYGDSDLVVQQSSGDWDAKDANMASYRFLVQQLSGYFEGCEFLHVPRNDNEQADALARIGSTRQAIPTGVTLQHLLKPFVKPSLESDSGDGLMDGLRRRWRETPVGIACRVEPIRARASAWSLSDLGT